MEKETFLLSYGEQGVLLGGLTFHLEQLELRRRRREDRLELIIGSGQLDDVLRGRAWTRSGRRYSAMSSTFSTFARSRW